MYIRYAYAYKCIICAYICVSRARRLLFSPYSASNCEFIHKWRGNSAKLISTACVMDNYGIVARVRGSKNRGPTRRKRDWLRKDIISLFRSSERWLAATHAEPHPPGKWLLLLYVYTHIYIICIYCAAWLFFALLFFLFLHNFWHLFW